MITVIDLSQMEVRNSYARLLNHLPGAVYRCEILLKGNELTSSYTTRLKFVSHGIYKLLGISPDELEYNTAMLDSMTLDEDLKKAREQICQSYREKKPYQLMYRMRLQDNTIKWFWDQGEVVAGENGLLFLEGLLMDFSAYKAHELALKKENARLQTSLEKIYGFGEIVGKSKPMRALYEQIQKAGSSNSTVLILGETGSGKELVAKNIYKLSQQKGNFIPVNCGAIPEQLMESEFFGYKKGAFSGATQNRDGFIRAAHNGTLFLDEVGELPLNLQVKLLRTLEDKTFTPVGSNTPEQSSFRLITATHQNLSERVEQKNMRSDFFYRINVLPISVPPLRERNGDIPLLMDAYLEQNNIKETMPLHVRMTMEHYSWPGNVRELKNFLERFFIFGESILEDLSPKQIFNYSVSEEETTLEKAMDAFEYKLIMQAMEKFRWKQADAAKYLDINLRTFQRKLKHHSISR